MSRTERQMRSRPMQFRAEKSETGNLMIAGYFAVFDSEYEMWPGATESIDSSAFDNTLDRDIRCLADHDTRVVLGRTKNGTLTLRKDEKGLYGEVLINQADTEALNLYERVKRGDIDQCSFGFEIVKEDFEDRGERGVHWTLKEVNLYEVSVVAFPAYEETAVEARKRELEQRGKRALDFWKEKTLKKLKGEGSWH